LSLINDPSLYENLPDGMRLRTGLSGDLLQGIVWDAISINYPNATTEVYKYYSGGLAGTLKTTITFTYTDVSKINISSVEKT